MLITLVTTAFRGGYGMSAGESLGNLVWGTQVVHIKLQGCIPASEPEEWKCAFFREGHGCRKDGAQTQHETH